MLEMNTGEDNVVKDMYTRQGRDLEVTVVEGKERKGRIKGKKKVR